MYTISLGIIDYDLLKACLTYCVMAVIVFNAADLVIQEVKSKATILQLNSNTR